VGANRVVWTTGTFGKIWRRSELPFPSGTGMGPYVQIVSANPQTRLWTTRTRGPDGFMAAFKRPTADGPWFIRNRSRPVFCAYKGR
jgi:hypothetical protein